MRRLVRPVLFTVVATAAVVGFVAAGRASPDPIVWGELGTWVERVEPVDAFAEMARWLGLALATYVAVVSFTALLGEFAGLVRLPRLHGLLGRLVGRVALPALKHRLLEVTAVATITASSMNGVTAGASPVPQPAAALIADHTHDEGIAAVRGEFHGFGRVGALSAVLPHVDSATHTVRAGDTLWQIVDSHYGRVDTALVDSVVEANPVIEDPDLIQVGWVLDLPNVALPDSPMLDSSTVEGEASWTVITVRPGDTLWGIVDDHYGEATAERVWATVEANPHIADPSLIHPGQVITLPPLGGDRIPPSSLDVAPPPEVHPSPPVPPEGQAAIEQPTATASASPSPPASTIPSSQVSEVPTSVVHDSGATPSTSPSPTVVDVPHEAVEGPEFDAEGDGAEDEMFPSIARAVGWTGGAGLAAALLALAARRRRRRPHRERHQRPSERAVQLGVALRETQHLDTATWAAPALAELATRIRSRPGEPTPVPRLLRLADDHVELVWDVPNIDVVAPWRTLDGGWSWNMDRPETISSIDAPHPCPAFVTIGQHDGVDVLLNLECCGALDVFGDSKAVDALVHSMTLELAASTFSDSPTILLVGSERLPGAPDHALVVDSDEALGWMRDRNDSATALLAHRRLTSLFALRARSRQEDSHEPVIVVVDRSVVSDDDLAQMHDLANGDLGTVLVVRGETVMTSWQLCCDDEHVELLPLGLRLARLGMVADLDCIVDELIPAQNLTEDLVDPDEMAKAEPPDRELVLADHVAVAHDRLPDLLIAREDESDWDVELKVLGQVRSEGTEQPLTPTELHLAIYLAFHPNGQSSDTIATMIWPDGVAHRTLTNTMASLRRKLGTGSDGEMLFPLGRDSQYLYKLSSRVTTDWHRFLDLARRAESLADDQAVVLLDQALALVDGPPFRATAGYSWAYSDGTASLIEETIEFAARRCAQIHESAGTHLDGREAIHVLQRVVGGSDVDEELASPSDARDD